MNDAENKNTDAFEKWLTKEGFGSFANDLLVEQWRKAWDAGRAASNNQSEISDNETPVREILNGLIVRTLRWDDCCGSQDDINNIKKEAMEALSPYLRTTERDGMADDVLWKGGYQAGFEAAQQKPVMGNYTEILQQARQALELYAKLGCECDKPLFTCADCVINEAINAIEAVGVKYHE